jgi:hypothetical protein
MLAIVIHAIEEVCQHAFACQSMLVSVEWWWWTNLCKFMPFAFRVRNVRSKPIFFRGSWWSVLIQDEQKEATTYVNLRAEPENRNDQIVWH